MINFLRGNIVNISFDSILIDVSGVGYLVYVARPQDFSYGDSLVYTYFQIREDGVSLFGFKTHQEQDIFLKLISVNGIGPKGASAILGATSVNSLVTAIEMGNIAFLKKLPTIGAKSASQIVLDLKGKLVQDMEDKTKDSVKNSEKYPDVYDALRQFGFKNQEVENVISKIENIDAKDVSEIIKECLKMLRK